MATNQLQQFLHKICEGHPTYLIGRRRVSPQDKGDYAAIVSGLSLWGCILLDQLDTLGFSQCTASSKGRIRNVQLLENDGIVDLTPSFRYIDECYDVLLGHLSAQHGFELHAAIRSLRALSATGSPWFPTCVKQILAYVAYYGEEIGGIGVARLLLQSFSFLRKIELDREDLLEDLISEWISHEAHLRDDVLPSLGTDHTEGIISEMNHLAREHCSAFSIVPMVPKHGPGAVADPSVKSREQKYLSMKQDARLQFLLRMHDLGTMSDYNPRLADGFSTRCSRFVGVPKTWKKLRGIAAEPVELQFFQQAVFASLDRMFHNSRFWRTRVNLHDQSVSQELAIKGSSTGRFATIDLSAASDSVTLELTRRVFKGTPVLKWLLGTRSTHCNVGGTAYPLTKISSMGSAVCFPLECMIFALAAQVASDRTPGRLSHKERVVRVFGDDIIVQRECVPALLDILTSLGFSVNAEKSYWDGWFREACGTFAYCGVDIRPIRYKRMGWIAGTQPVEASDVSQLVAFANQLRDRGLQNTRKDLLELFISKRIPVGPESVPAVQSLVFTFSGDFGTVASNSPTNFHLSSRWNASLQASEYRVICWKKRFLRGISPEIEMPDVDYVEWLLRHQVGAVSTTVDDVPGFRAYARELGATMIPTRKWVDTQAHDWADRIVI